MQPFLTEAQGRTNFLISSLIYLLIPGPPEEDVVVRGVILSDIANYLIVAEDSGLFLYHSIFLISWLIKGDCFVFIMMKNKRIPTWNVYPHVYTHFNLFTTITIKKDCGILRVPGFKKCKIKCRSHPCYFLFPFLFFFRWVIKGNKYSTVTFKVSWVRECSFTHR